MMLKDKVVLVTGASRGIGAEIAKGMAREGADVVVNYLKSKEMADRIIEEIILAGSEAIPAKADVSKYGQVRRMVDKAVRRFGRIDVLVNNAGIIKDRLLINMTQKDWDTVVDVNLRGTFNTTKIVAPYMIQKGSGRIINIASLVGQAGNIGQINYTSSKAGVIGFTKSAARELAKYGINVNAISPGFIQTEMSESIPDNIVTKFLKNIPMGRVGRPEEIVGTVVFLASDMSDYVTGQVINVNGGLYM